MQATISAKSVSKTFAANGDEKKILSNVDLEVRQGEILCLVGLSGCGKTTLLRMLAGLLAPTSGEIRLCGRLIDGPAPEALLLFQDYSRSLLPWRRVLGNVELGLEPLKLTSGDRRQRAEEALGLVGLSKFSSYFPWQLSGGMQQRVTLARALACQPPILLMDEPFGSIDAPARHRLEDELLNLWRDQNLTILLVTHDLDEAIYLGERVALLGGIPASIGPMWDIPFSFPRCQISTKGHPDFAALRSEIYRELEGV